MARRKTEDFRSNFRYLVLRLTLQDLTSNCILGAYVESATRQAAIAGGSLDESQLPRGGYPPQLPGSYGETPSLRSPLQHSSGYQPPPGYSTTNTAMPPVVEPSGTYRTEVHQYPEYPQSNYTHEILQSQNLPKSSSSNQLPKPNSSDENPL